jgi:hypothetical protein
MSSAYSIIKNAHKKGLKFLGAGCYSAVFQGSDSSSVIKIGADIFDPYLYYVRELQSSNSDNVHFPKVKSLFVDNENGYYVVKLEKLFPLRKSIVNKYQDIYDWAVNCKSKPEWVSGPLEVAVNTIIDLADFRNYEDIVDAKVWDKLPADACRLDLHDSNVMCRADGTMVFADPLCNYKMYDVPAVEEWMEHELGYQFDFVLDD